MARWFSIVIVIILSITTLFAVQVYGEHTCTVSFVADGNEVGSYKVEKGAIFSDYPQVPEKLGFDGRWESAVHAVNSNEIINAVYTRLACGVNVENKYSDLVTYKITSGTDYWGVIGKTVTPISDTTTHIGMVELNGQVVLDLTFKEGFELGKLDIVGKYGKVLRLDDGSSDTFCRYAVTKIPEDIVLKIVPAVSITSSLPSGFYDHDIDLTLSSLGEIHYTLDGTTPTRDSPLYSSSLHLSDASLNENVYSARDDYSVGYEKGVYTVPDTLVDKCNVIRARAFYGDLENLVNMTYFIGFDDKSGYDEMNIISLITDPYNLFDSKDGIYVTGDIYEEFKQNDPPHEHWQWYDANYRQKGSEWERPATIQIFGADGSLVCDQDVGIRNQGGGSRGFIPHSLNIYARDEYGNDRIAVDLFGNGFMAQRLTLFAGGDDYLVKIKDKLVSELTADCNYAKNHYQSMCLFIDGEFWGYYWIVDKYDEEYLQFYYSLLNDDVIMIKNAELEVGVPEDIAQFQEYAALCELDYSVAANYQYFCSKVDINSFIDYYATEIYIGRSGDWNPSSNYAIWKTRNVDPGEYSDGKWRMMLFDVNSGAMSADLWDVNSIEITRGSDAIFASLLNSSEFKEQLKQRLIQIAEMMNPTVTDAYIESYRSNMIISLTREYERFHSSENNLVDSFNENLDSLKLFFQKRYTFIDTLIAPLESE